MKNNTLKKIIIIGLAAVVIAAFAYLDIGRFLTLDYIKASQDGLADLYAEHTFSVLAVYTFAYLVVAALSLPGAGVMSLAGGALFGLFSGTIVVSIASTVGATIACGVSRFVLRSWVLDKFGEKLEPINEGIDREGGFYLFTLRLIPIFPFFVINLVMGLTRMPLRTFFWVSQLGMLPATLVFVNAGKELGKIESAGDILSPSLIFSFVILGLFPITAKKVMAIVRRKLSNSKILENENGKI